MYVCIRDYVFIYLQVYFLLYAAYNIVNTISQTLFSIISEENDFYEILKNRRGRKYHSNILHIANICRKKKLFFFERIGLSVQPIISTRQMWYYFFRMPFNKYIYKVSKIFNFLSYSLKFLIKNEKILLFAEISY